MDEEIWKYEMMMKLSGVIFRKALIENDFQKVYDRVFNVMSEHEINNEFSFLEIFGDVGG